MMTKELEFKDIVAQYCDFSAEEILNNMRFREDLGFSSLSFMSFLGELEDTFDLELDEEKALQVRTIEEAMKLLEQMN